MAIKHLLPVTVTIKKWNILDYTCIKYVFVLASKLCFFFFITLLWLHVSFTSIIKYIDGSLIEFDITLFTK